MDTSRERDQAVERLLRQSLKAPRLSGVTDSCLDAETVAAWVDGGLSGAALEMAQSHVADCARCQSLVGAMARTNAVVPQPEHERAPRRWLAWLVPLTAAAAVVALWVAIPREKIVPAAPVPAAAELQKQAADADAQEPALRNDQPRAPAAEEKETRPAQVDANKEREAPADELGRENGRLEADGLRQREKVSAPAAAPPAAPAAQGAAAARSANAFAERVAVGIEIASPDPSVRWRIAGSVVERSTNGGASWDAVPTGIAAELTAGAAPSTTVCWVVGRAGVVLLSIDGRTWRRIAFPEITDLSAVRATDARTASVSTADGRTFSTSDGGLTWTRGN